MLGGIKIVIKIINDQDKMKSSYVQDNPQTQTQKEPLAPIQTNINQFTSGFCRSQTRVFLKKLRSNQTQVFPKQYTNKYFRTRSLYEEKENSRLLQFNRLSTLTRKTRAAVNFRLKKYGHCFTEPNEGSTQSELSIASQPRVELGLKPRKGNNSTSSDMPTSVEMYVSENKLVLQLLNRAKKPRRLREISMNCNPFENFCPNSSKEKTSTSRALQKYARVIKQNIFELYKPPFLETQPLKKKKPHYCSSDIETKQLFLYPKENRQPKSHTKKLLHRLKPHILQSYSQEQNYDLKGWQT